MADCSASAARRSRSLRPRRRSRAAVSSAPPLVFVRGIDARQSIDIGGLWWTPGGGIHPVPLVRRSSACSLRWPTSRGYSEHSVPPLTMNAQASPSGRSWPYRNSHSPRPFRLPQVDAAGRDGRDDPSRPLAEPERMSERALHEPPLGASWNPARGRAAGVPGRPSGRRGSLPSASMSTPSSPLMDQRAHSRPPAPTSF